MPRTTTATRPRRKTISHIRHWSASDRALVERGSLTIWIWEEALAAWAYQGPRQRGAQLEYRDRALEAGLTLKEVFHLSNREAEGLGRSVIALMAVALSRRGRAVQIQACTGRCTWCWLAVGGRFSAKAQGRCGHPVGRNAGRGARCI